MRSFTICASLGCALVIAGCNDGTQQHPAQPSAVEPEAPERPWSLAGRVSTLQDGQAVVEADLTGAGRATVTEHDGTFVLEGTERAGGSFLLGASKPGYLTREMWVPWGDGPRDPVDVTMIRDAPPFALSFYRRFVRDAGESPDALEPTRRWTWGPPHFYIKLDNGLGRRSSILDRDLVVRLIQDLVPVLTGGVYPAGRIESGVEDRNAAGWITVELVHLDEPICGRAYVGANPGRIWINTNQGQCHSGSCTTGEAIRAETVAHELGHALGFFHTDGTGDIMNDRRASRACDVADFSPAERFHAWVAYQRPRDNIDPDRDPPQMTLLAQGATGGPVVSCFASDRHYGP
jgi:hypothetical protein